MLYPFHRSGGSVHTFCIEILELGEVKYEYDAVGLGLTIHPETRFHVYVFEKVRKNVKISDVICGCILEDLESQEWSHIKPYRANESYCSTGLVDMKGCIHISKCLAENKSLGMSLL